MKKSAKQTKGIPSALNALLAIFVICLFLISSQSKANVVCDEIGKLFFEIAISAQGISLASDVGQAEIFEPRLDLALDQLSHQDLKGLVNRKAFSTIKTFTNARRLLLTIYRDLGLRSAKIYYQNEIDQNSSLTLTRELKNLGCELAGEPSNMENIFTIKNTEQLRNIQFSSYILNAKPNINNEDGFFSRISLESLSIFKANYMVLPLVILSIGILFAYEYFEKRTATRFDVDLETVALFNGTSFDIHLCNISASGTRFSTGYGLNLGDELMIIIEKTSVLAEVKWIGDMFVGVQFAKKLKKRQVKAIVRHNS